MPEVTEPLMGAGRMVVPMLTDALYDEFFDDLGRARMRHIAFYDGHRLLYQGPIFACRPGGALILEGGLMAWWLGVENEGPPNDFRRYPSGVSMLSNGDFESGEIAWRRRDANSKWVIGTAEEINGTRGSWVNVDRKDDDELQHEETHDVFPGDTLRLRANVYHPDGGDGNIRIRAVFNGIFKHPNLNVDPNFDDPDLWETGDALDMEIVNDPAHAYGGNTNVLKIGPTTKERFLDDEDFEAGFGAWDDFNEVEISTERAHRGTQSVKFKSGGLDTAAIQQDVTGVQDGDEFDCAMALSWADADVPVVFRVLWKDLDGDFQVTQAISEVHFPGTGFRLFTGNFSLTNLDDTVDPKVIVAADDIIASGGAAFLDSVAMKRVRGNVQAISWKDRDVASEDTIAIIPGRRYRVRAKFLSDQSVYNGEVWIRARLRREPLGAADEYVDLPHQGVTDGKYVKYEHEFTAPSGYDRLLLQVFHKDVYGGSFWLGQLDIDYADPNELVVDLEVSPSEADSGPFVATFTYEVPSGAENVRYVALVEDDGEGWRHDDAELIWVADPTPAADVIRDALDGTGLSEGDINDAGDILFDLLFRNRTSRQIIDEVSGMGVVQPEREHRTNADGTFDWGLPSEIFEDRDTFILKGGGIFLAPKPDVLRSMEEFVDRVKLIGAERRKRSGAPWVVVGEATNPDLGLELFDGSDFVRTKYIEDGSVNHPRFADNRARMEADELADIRPSYDITVRDPKALGRFATGDWIYIEDEKSGIRGTEPVPLDGEIAYPVRMRALESKWKLGRGIRAKLRRGPGDVVDITEHVKWPDRTEVTITVGTRRRSFITNPQGGDVSTQWFRFRKQVGEE